MVRRTAVGAGAVRNLKDFLATGGEYKLTFDLKYFLRIDGTGYYAIANFTSVPVYFELIYIVNPGIKSVRMSRTSSIVMHVENGQFGDDGSWRYIYSGIIPPKGDSVVAAFTLLLTPGSFMLEPRCQWTLRTAVVPRSPPLAYPSPAYYDDGLLEYPYLGTPLSERDEVPLGAFIDDPEALPVEQPAAPVQVYVGPPTQEYFIFGQLGDEFSYALYHELLNRYSKPLATKWSLNQNSQGDGAYLYQRTVNGNGWLDLSKDTPGWDPGDPHLIYFTSVSGLWVIGDGKGRHIAWSNYPSVGAYDSSLASFPLVFTTDVSAALKFKFSRADGYIGP